MQVGIELWQDIHATGCSNHWSLKARHISTEFTVLIVHCSGMHTDGAPPLTDFALSSLAHLFLLKIGRTVTKSHDLLSLHVGPKIDHFCDLCTKHMKLSFFLKRDNTLVIGSCLKFRCFGGVKKVEL